MKNIYTLFFAINLLAVSASYGMERAREFAAAQMLSVAKLNVSGVSFLTMGVACIGCGVTGPVCCPAKMCIMWGSMYSAGGCGMLYGARSLATIQHPPVIQVMGTPTSSPVVAAAAVQQAIAAPNHSDNESNNTNDRARLLAEQETELQ